MSSGPRIGELFSGYGGLGMGVQAVYGGTVAWHSEIDPGACKILAHRYPDVPNLGDITTVNWSAVEPVEIVTGGFPCTDLSKTGRRAGLRPGTRSGLWSHMAFAINQLRPALVVAENVRGLLSGQAASDVEPCPWCLGDQAGCALRALGAVLADLAELGYDAKWHSLRASDVGAPHERERVFLVASPTNTDGRLRGHYDRLLRGPQGPARCSPSLDDGASRPRAPLAQAGPSRPNIDTWREYADVVANWEATTGNAAPSLDDDQTVISEWLMGLPAGWVTDVPGITRTEALKAIGNGVVPQQAAEALWVMDDWTVAA